MITMLDLLAGLLKNAPPSDYGNPAIAGATPVPLSPDNFSALESKSGVVGFVDGGNNVLFVSPAQAVHMVRLYYSVFDGGRKVRFKLYNFLINAIYKPDAKKYVLEIYDIDNSRLFPDTFTEFSEDEIDRREGIKGIGAYVRRVGEWLLSERVLDYVDILVRDGALQTGEKRESDYADGVFNKVDELDKVIVGFSKTCSLITDRGFSLLAAVHHLSLKHSITAPWVYHPIAKGISTIKGDMFIVKLHPRAEYVFRVEVYPDSRAKEALSVLVPLSNDPVFLGYPYGLIDADVHARIKDEEAKMYGGMLYRCADEFSRLQANALNAHDIISEVK